ncbi:MAG: DUF3800 domain-containing protein [Nitrospirae bacterium]|nr:DUF3800 domain-containing protein [Nitrospirota bacterium]
MALVAYFDESGHSSNTRFVCIGGLITTNDDWQVFSKHWTATLNAVGVSGLHMREFAHSRGQFAGWDEQRRRDLLTRLMALVHGADMTTIGVVFPMPVWHSLSDIQKRELVDPYFPCLQEVFNGALVHAAITANDSITLVVADHPEFGAKAQSLWNTYRASHPFGHYVSDFQRRSPGQSAPLQAADWVAYEVLKSCEKNSKGKQNDRWPFAQFLRTDAMLKFLDADYIRRQVAGFDS